MISNPNTKRHREHINRIVLYFPFTAKEINITLYIIGKVFRKFKNLTNCPDLGQKQLRLLDFVSSFRSKPARSSEAIAGPPWDRSPVPLLNVVSRILEEATLNAPLP